MCLSHVLGSGDGSSQLFDIGDKVVAVVFVGHDSLLQPRADLRLGC